MKKMALCGIILLSLSFIGMQPQTAEAATYENMAAELQNKSGSIQMTEEKEEAAEYLDIFREELDFSELDDILETELFAGEREPIRFSDIVDGLLSDGVSDFDYDMLEVWVRDALLYELDENRKILVEVVLLAVAFSILKNFSRAFKQAYISEISFLMVYGTLAVLLMQSFAVYEDIAGEALQKSVDFMKALVPTFCVSMVFSAGTATSASFYQVAFLIIYLIQWLFLKVLMPLIQGYVLIELFNHFFEDLKFENLTELIKSIVNWGINSAGVVVLGLNVVQGLTAPAKDRLTSGLANKAAALIPGVGTAMSGIGELLLGSGILIKNCVGVAALVLLVMIGLIPVLKIWCISFFYKLAAVAVEPVADKRIAGCLKGMAEGGLMYLKLVIYCLALFMATIALTTAASGIMR